MKLYKFANRVHMMLHDEQDIMQNHTLDERSKRIYEQAVLAAIRKDRKRAGRTRLKAAAACLAVLTGATILFHEEATAAIDHIGYSLRVAMGLESDLAQYKEVVHTSVRDGGYIVTLEEAAAAPEKLAVSYTVCREDGRPFSGSQSSFHVDDQLLINGAHVVRNTIYESRFLDTEETIIGGQIVFEITDADLIGVNTYDLKLENDSGTWKFRFEADGSQLCADTKHLALGDRYRLANGVEIILDELSMNALEQRILFHKSGGKDLDLMRYMLTLHAVDEQGRTAEFYMKSTEDGIHYVMQAEKNKGIASDAKTVTVTLQAVEFVKEGPKTENGQIYKGSDPVIVPPVNTTSDGTAVWDLERVRTVVSIS